MSSILGAWYLMLPILAQYSASERAVSVTAVGDPRETEEWPVYFPRECQENRRRPTGDSSKMDDRRSRKSFRNPQGESNKNPHEFQTLRDQVRNPVQSRDPEVHLQQSCVHQECAAAQPGDQEKLQDLQESAAAANVPHQRWSLPQTEGQLSSWINW